MKKAFLTAIAALALLPALTACGKTQDSAKYLSEIKRDIFLGETEEFSVTLSCSEREVPYASDGVACPMEKLVEISLVARDGGENYSVEVAGDTPWGGDMSFRNVKGDYYYSQGVDAFPAGSVDITVTWEEGSRTLVATSVKTEKTLTPEQALGCAVAHEKETIDALTQDGVFCGEYRVRLMRRDANFYYVGIVDKDGNTVSLLLNSETGEVLARRESRLKH